MLHSVSDDDFARHVKDQGMATPGQIEEARKQAPLPLAEALVKMGVITALQRELVEKKLEARPGGVSELAGCKLLKKIGEGGMGAVYLADDSLRKRKVAIKILPKKHAADAEYLKRFRREAEAAAKLDHPNIVQAYSTGEERGYHFYVMEYCEGESLRKRIERLKFLPAGDACALVVQIARGLQHAHGQGFIHRDVKPENLIVTPAGVVKILDLGLAKNLDDSNATFRTVTGAALGTPHYISPEQARGDKSVDGRTDIYSLGATFYHLITGQVPFQGSSIFEIIQKHLMEQLADPRDVRPEISAEVVEVVRKMLAKAPADRYADCTELINDLERLAAKQPPLAKPIDAALSSMALPKNIARAAAAAAPPPRRSGVVIGAAAAAVVLVGILGYAVWPTPTPLAPPEPPKKTPPPALVKSDPPKVVAPEPKVEAPKPEPKPEPKAEPNPEPKPEPKPEQPKEEPKPEPKPEAKPEPAPAPEPVKPELPKPAKFPIPDPAKRAAAEAAFRKNNTERLAKNSPSERARFARDLLDLPVSADPAEQYYRLGTARDFAAQGGDPATVLAAVDRLSDGFVIQHPLALKTEGLVACSTRVKEMAAATADAALGLLDETIDADRFDLAMRLAAKAKTAAEPWKSDDLKTAYSAADRFLKESASVSAHFQTLAQKPDDATANFNAGKFLCLVKEDWDRGLPRLAKGAHKEYRGLAEKELLKEKDSKVLTELCEGWLALAKSEMKGIKKDNLARRAHQWFTEARSSFSPADAGKIEKDLETLVPKDSVQAPKPGPAKAGLPKNGVDVLPRLKQDAMDKGRGVWTLEQDGSIVSPGFGDNNENPSLINISFAPPEEYDLYIDVQRVSGWTDLVFGLNSGTHEFAMGIDGWGGNGSGINGPNGRFAWTQPQYRGRVFNDGRLRRIRFEVRKTGARMYVEDALILTLDDYRQSSVPSPSLTQGRERFPAGTRFLSIGTVNTSYRISRVYVVNKK